MITSSDLLNIYSWFLASISMGVRMTSFFIAVQVEADCPTGIEPPVEFAKIRRQGSPTS